ncbi:MAG: hypothetical protein Q7T13_01695 [Polaromonas sp.]|nr:hypothetical protein [Polaromonas sp.]
MKHYKKPDGSVWAFEEDGSQDHLITVDMEPYALPDPSPPTAYELKSALVNAVQLYLDQGAQSLGYDDLKTAATYADEPAVPQFQNEGRALRAWRSLTWAYCHGVLADVLAEARPIPTAPELIAELPAFVIPE